MAINPGTVEHCPTGCMQGRKKGKIPFKEHINESRYDDF
jgi:hypothetical protein